MDERKASATLLRAMAAELHGEVLEPQRAGEVAEDLNRLLVHARAAAAGNGFDAEPGQFAVALARLARPGPGAA